MSPLEIMSNLTYFYPMNADEKDLVWLHGAVKTPPFSGNAHIEAGFLLRQLQQGLKLSMPHARPMPTVGRRCHELRINDSNSTGELSTALIQMQL